MKILRIPALIGLFALAAAAHSQQVTLVPFGAIGFAWDARARMLGVTGTVRLVKAAGARIE